MNKQNEEMSNNDSSIKNSILIFSISNFHHTLLATICLFPAEMKIILKNYAFGDELRNDSEDDIEKNLKHVSHDHHLKSEESEIKAKSLQIYSLEI